MPKFYSNICEQCGMEYKGRGQRFCSNHCRVTWTNLNKNVAWREDVKRKISKSRIGKPTTLGNKLTSEHRREISNKLTGRKFTQEHRWAISRGVRKGKIAKRWENMQLKLFNGHTSRIFTETHKNNLSNSLKGENAPNWKGGITDKNKLIRRSKEYREWRKFVYERDNYICQICGAHSGNGKAIYLEAHHVKQFADYPELRFDKSNGITLCKDCHKNIRKSKDDSIKAS